MPNRYNRQAAANRLAAYVSPAECRKRSQDRKGLALIAVCVLGFAALFGSAIVHDSYVAPMRAKYESNLAAKRQAKAEPVRLIGKCDGRILAAMEESDFPAGCTWIVPVTPESI